MTTSLELAITAIRSNRKDEGRQLLNLLIQENPNNELAWLWMSSVVDTDEQRARCLYHVLAINPDNQVARRGLQILGIVVSDSRPVKVPRDSQPIQIPKPSPPNSQFIPDTQPLEQEPKSEPIPTDERRPFRIDRQAIVDELPFKPISKPFTEVLPSATSAAPSATDPAKQAEQAANPSEPVPVVQTGPAGPGGGAVENPADPSQPMPVVQPHASPAPNPALQAPGTGPLQPGLPQQPGPDSGPFPHPGLQQPVAAGAQPTGQAGQYYPPQAAPAPQQFVAGTGPPTDTRPSQPVPVTPVQTPYQPMPVVQPNVPMAVPAQPGQVQGYSQPVSPVHSNTTMAMPTPNQSPDPADGQFLHPSEPVPVIHANTTMGMPAYGQPQVQQPLPQNQAPHSNSTMMMPVGVGPVATPPGQPGMVDYRLANAAPVATGAQPNPKGKNDAEDEEEINILAVIIFGSLSVTALGGLGMLILLMFAI